MITSVMHQDHVSTLRSSGQTSFMSLGLISPMPRHARTCELADRGLSENSVDISKLLFNRENNMINHNGFWFRGTLLSDKPKYLDVFMINHWATEVGLESVLGFLHGPLKKLTIRTPQEMCHGLAPGCSTFTFFVCPSIDGTDWNVKKREQNNWHLAT